MAELVTKRYAKALFDVAEEKNTLEAFEQEALKISEILKENISFLQILGHPNILQEEKIKLVEEAFDGNASNEIVGLLVLLVKKSRENYMIDILDEFVNMAKVAQGFLQATVTSAIPLQQEQLSKIKSNIENNTSKKIELNAVVDESIIGGMIIQVGDKVIDGSIKGKMQALKSDLNNLRLA